MQLKDLGEFGLIDLIARRAGLMPAAVIRGIGDDAAVIRGAGTDCLLITTDILHESIHFQRALTSPFLLGKKSLAVNLSDIAAMGGVPLCYCVALTAPAATPAAMVKELYRGMQAQARPCRISLVGGDISAAAELISIVITVVGRAPRSRIVYRTGALRGDLIYVSGSLGDAALGLMALQQNRALRGARALIRKHLDPVPRLDLGRQLARQGLASSMIDISDGLLADLGHILDASSVGGRLRLADLPLSGSYRKHCAQLTNDLYKPALCGGEDYELLFTARPVHRNKIERLARRLQIRLTCIGEITAKGEGLLVVDVAGREHVPTGEGFRHF